MRTNTTNRYRPFTPTNLASEAFLRPRSGANAEYYGGWLDPTLNILITGAFAENRPCGVFEIHFEAQSAPIRFGGR